MTEVLTECPCCGAALPLGLFSREAKVGVPTAIEQMHDHSFRVIERCGGLLFEAVDRHFIACRATLPLNWDDSPISVGVWVEIDAQQARQLMHMISQGSPSGELSGAGHLACDVPGFAGSHGARVAFGWPGDEHDPRPRITHCADGRLRQIGWRNHEDLVILYRRVWGGTGEVLEAKPELRAAVATVWRDVIGRLTYRKDVEPPPRFAGIDPAEVIIAPPVDTGGEVIIATLGMAEAEPRKAVELITFARDVGDSYTNSFAEFCYLTRFGRTVQHGSVISERGGIPESDDMSSWLICEPWWAEEPDTSVSFAAIEVKLLAAVPIHQLEHQWATRNGSGALISALESADLDIFDLHRPSVVVPA